MLSVWILFLRELLISPNNHTGPWLRKRIYERSSFPLKSKQHWEPSMLESELCHISVRVPLFKLVFNIISSRSHEQRLPGVWCSLCLLWYFWHDGLCNGLLTFCSLWISWKSSRWRQYLPCSVSFSFAFDAQSFFMPYIFQSCGSREGGTIRFLSCLRVGWAIIMSGPFFLLPVCLWLKYNVSWTVKCGMVIQLFLS